MTSGQITGGKGCATHAFLWKICLMFETLSYCELEVHNEGSRNLNGLLQNLKDFSLELYGWSQEHDG
jgi:hypothetical protein